MEETAFNPKRRLCSDGSCVGILGGDGRCSVCQRSGAADGESFPEAPDRAFGASYEAAAESSAGASGDSMRASELADGTSSGFDPGRRLCDDGSCVGIVGADGVCGTCGRRAQ
jgi:hypothetical protein